MQFKIGNIRLSFGGAPRQVCTAPAAADIQRLQDQSEVVSQILEQHYPGASLNDTAADLALLQRILDDGRLQPHQTYELQCLGIVLGSVMVKEIGFHWVTVEDEYGRDPALQYQDTSILVYPLTMISKRVERGERVEVAELFRTTQEQVNKLKNRMS
jgi:hypothetical protein